MIALLADAAAEAGRRGFHVTGPQLLVGLIAILVAALCVLFHYEVMSLSSRHLPRFRLPPRGRIVALIFAVLGAHVVEIWIFGSVYWLLERWPSLGSLAGPFHDGALDYVYFSAMTYTTVGFGDVVPLGPVRVLAGTEALVGLGLITWSASLAFLEMQRDWREFR